MHDLVAVTKLTTTRTEEDEDGQQIVTAGNVDLVDAQITRVLRKLGPERAPSSTGCSSTCWR